MSGVTEPRSDLSHNSRASLMASSAPSSSSRPESPSAGGGQGPTMVQYRAAEERPVLKLSVYLIDTYKHINKIYYEARARRAMEEDGAGRGGVNNHGYDDQHYDYIVQAEEVIQGRYILKHKVGKGSFGQVVCAWDQEHQVDVAIKIIKSRRPFLAQALTEIDLLTRINERDDNDEHNLVRLLNHFNFRNHQCLVFEMLSCNLYELLKNTKYNGVSLNLIRKFSKQILKALEFLARPDVDVVHCDLKPENILLRHPRRSAIKMIDFGSSCLTTERKYTYIQSRFYRSPEILLGLPYDQKIDLWSLGCVLVEMHTGEPLFGGSDQVDQMCRVVDMLGMPPLAMLDASPPATRSLFFERIDTTQGQVPSPDSDAQHILRADMTGDVYYILKRPHQEAPRAQKLADVIGVYTSGPNGRRREQDGHSVERYLEFLDFIQKLLIFDPAERHSASLALQHPYLFLGPEITGFVPPAAPSADETTFNGPKMAIATEPESSSTSSTAAMLNLNLSVSVNGVHYSEDPNVTPGASVTMITESLGKGSAAATSPRVRSRSAMANEARQRSRVSPPQAAEPQVVTMQDADDGTPTPTPEPKNVGMGSELDSKSSK